MKTYNAKGKRKANSSELFDSIVYDSNPPKKLASSRILRSSPQKQSVFDSPVKADNLDGCSNSSGTTKKQFQTKLKFSSTKTPSSNITNSKSSNVIIRKPTTRYSARRRHSKIASDLFDEALSQSECGNTSVKVVPISLRSRRLSNDGSIQSNNGRKETDDVDESYFGFDDSDVSLLSAKESSPLEFEQEHNYVAPIFVSTGAKQDHSYSFSHSPSSEKPNRAVDHSYAQQTGEKPKFSWKEKSLPHRDHTYESSHGEMISIQNKILDNLITSDFSQDNDEKTLGAPESKVNTKAKLKTALPRHNTEPVIDLRRSNRDCSSLGVTQSLDTKPTIDHPGSPGKPEADSNTSPDKKPARRRRILCSPKKTSVKAKYNMKSWLSEGDGVTEETEDANSPPNEKYTMVKNCKSAHEISEMGETQQIVDDLEWLMDGIKGKNQLQTRSLSAIGFAGKCAKRSFRLHVRAHDSLSRILKAMRDALRYQSLSFCTASILFMLSSEGREGVELTPQLLVVVLQLMSVHKKWDNLTDSDTGDFAKCQEKMSKILTASGAANENSVDDKLPTVYDLALETLLSLALAKSEKWFQDKLRVLQGLGLMLDSLCSWVDRLSAADCRWSSLDRPTLKLVKSCTKCLCVIETVTLHNLSNIEVLLSHNDGRVIESLVKLLRLSWSALELIKPGKEDDASADDPASLNAKTSKPGKGYQESGLSSKKHTTTVAECLISVLRAMVHLAHDDEFEYNSSRVGQQPGLVSSLLRCILNFPLSIPWADRHDILVLSLGLLINLVVHSAGNRLAVLDVDLSVVMPARRPEVQILDLLVGLYNEYAAIATLAEQETVDQLKKTKSSLVSKKEKGVNDRASIKECLDRAQKNADKHLENSNIASYTALLLGCLVKNDPEHLDRIKANLPDGSLNSVIERLHWYLEFFESTFKTDYHVHKAAKHIAKVVEIFENYG